jgi:hypothetical protein
MSTAEEKAYNRAVKDWERVRSAIEHENNLINHRQTWHAMLQLPLVGGMFAVYTEIGKAVNVELVRDKSNIPSAAQIAIPLLVLPIVGMLLSIFIQISIYAAVDHMKRLEKWWAEKYSGSDLEAYLIDHPYINGLFDEKRIRDLNTAFIPTLFSGAWGVALVVSCITLAVRFASQSVVWASVAFFLGLACNFVVQFGAKKYLQSKSTDRVASASESKPTVQVASAPESK